MFIEASLSAILYDFGRLTGFLAFFPLVLLIFLGDTSKFFDQYFGFDKIIPFLKKLSYFVAFFVLLHPLLFMISKQKFLDFIIPDFTLYPLAFGILSFYIFFTIMIASAVYKRISHHTWQYLHILNYILFFLILQHAEHWGSTALHPAMNIAYKLSLLLIILGIIYRTQYKFRKKSIYELQDVRDDNYDTKTLILNRIQPKREPRYTAGQFGLFRFPDKNKKLHARHPFTLSKAASGNTLEITIKKAGKFTEALFNMKKGDKLLAEGAFGTFTLKKCKCPRQVFIAGGVGITPYKAMLEELFKNKKHKKTFLFYGAKKQKDVLFKDFFDDNLSTQFKAVYCLSKEDDKKGFEDGYIDEKMLLKYISTFEDTCFYICGPEPMKKAIIKILKKNKVSKKNIIVEDFFW